MTISKKSSRLDQFLKLSIFIFVIFLLLLQFSSIAFAQSASADEIRVQEMTGTYEFQHAVIYSVTGLKQGELLYVYAEGLNGNLDPFVGVTDQDIDPIKMSDDFIASVGDVAANDRDPLDG